MELHFLPLLDLSLVYKIVRLYPLPHLYQGGEMDLIQRIDSDVTNKNYIKKFSSYSMEI